MLKLLFPATVAILMTLMACTGATPTPAPTEATTSSTIAATSPLVDQTPTPEATTTPKPPPAERPTAAPTTPAKSPTPDPEPTPVPPGALSPLDIQDPQALLAGLSDSELDCIGDPSILARTLAGPGAAPRDEQERLIGCLKDETVARLFLAGFVGDSGTLSQETSTCIRAVFGIIDPREVMTAGMEGDPGAAMAGSMAAFPSTLACLNETEWEAAAPKVGIDPEERGEVLCLLDELGGAAELATALMEAGQGNTTAISRAGVGCGMNPEPGPTPMEVPATPTPTPTEPKPESTPVSTTAPTPTTAPPTPTKAPATPTLTPTPEPTATAPPAKPEATWRGITVAPEDRCSPYDADDYPYPQSVEPKIVEELGGIYGPYTGNWFETIRETDIEHIVARSEAHDSGLCAVDAGTKAEFASDILNLTLASPSVNRHQKVAKDPAEWLPELNGCWYVDRVIQVRREYGLTIDRAEAEAIDGVLAGCDSTELVVLTPGKSVATATPIPSPDVDALALYDDNGNGRITCAEARAHGIAPVLRGHPAYEFMNDRDGDGVVCE